MTKQKQMTEKELDQVSGGPHIKNFNGRLGVMLCGGTCPDAIRRSGGKFMAADFYSQLVRN